ncbi:MAG: NAD(+) synthase, partial [Thermoplasmata archaeon]
MPELVPRFREDQVKIVESFIAHHLEASGRKGLVLGLSGGVDSALVAKLCVDAIGADRVLALGLPEGKGGKDLEDARAWAKELGFEFRVMDIAPMVASFDEHLRAREVDRVARGNLRARTRMVVLYFVANTENRLVMGTGNKSELLTGYFCYDSETRILTPEGPRSYWEVKPGSVVFSIDLETRKVVEVPVESVHVFDYEGDLIEIKTRRLDLLVTPNHRLLISRDHGVGSLAFETAEDRMLAGGATAVPTPIPWDGVYPAPSVIDTARYLPLGRLSWNANQPIRMATEDFLYLMGLHIGDGTISVSLMKDGVKSDLTQSERAKVRDTLGRFAPLAGGKETVRVYERPRMFIASGEGKRSRAPLLTLLERYNVHASQTPTLVAFSNHALSASFAECGAGAKSKQIPPWVLKLPAQQLRFLYRGLMDSDGNADGYAYTTTSSRLAYQMVELSAKIGLHARVSQRPPKTTSYRGKQIRSSGVFVVRISPLARTLTFLPRNMRRVHYKGKVWCPSVPPHENILVERHGRTVFCGNTKYGDGGADFLPLGDLYKTQVRDMARHLGLPKKIIDKVPAAGLWPGQTDEGELRISYDELDRILLGIELQMEPEAIAEKAGAPLDHVRRIEDLVAATAYKRKMPLIPKLGVRTLGLDWRE